MHKDKNYELTNFPPPAYRASAEKNRDEQSGDSSPHTPSLTSRTFAIHQGIPKPIPLQPPGTATSFQHLHPDTTNHPSRNPSPIQITRRNRIPRDTSWARRHRWLIFSTALANIPFIIFFLVDIVGTQFPKSILYHKALYVTGGARQNGLPFHVVYTAIAMLTALANLNFFSLYRKAIRSENYPPDETRSRKIFKKIILWGSFIVSMPLMAAWPFAAYKIHTLIKPVFKTCKERGFGSSILLQVANSISASPLNGNIATISSTNISGMSFSLDLRATTLPGEDISTFFVTPRPSSISPPALIPRIWDKSMAFNITAHTYNFNFTAPSITSPFVSSQYVKHGKFLDSPRLYLSFPSLSVPLHSTGKRDWSAIGDPKTPPSLEIANDRPGSTTVIKTVEGEKEDDKCTQLRMCSAWSVEEMAGDVEIMESVFVVIGRVGVEMIKYGISC